MGECKCSITSVLDCHEEHGISHCPRHSDANVARLEARVRTLEEGVRTYGRDLDECERFCHAEECRGLRTHKTCTCGLDTLLTMGGGT